MIEDDFLSDKELACLLGISVKALRNKISAGSKLPKRIQPPGCKTRLWRKQDVYEWLETYTVINSVENTSIRRF